MKTHIHPQTNSSYRLPSATTPLHAKKRLLRAVFDPSHSWVEFCSTRRGNTQKEKPRSSDTIILTASDCFVYCVPIPARLSQAGQLKSFVANYLKEHFPRDLSLLDYQYKILARKNPSSSRTTGQTIKQRCLMIIAVYKDVLKLLRQRLKKIAITVSPLLLWDKYNSHTQFFHLTMGDISEEVKFKDGMLEMHSVLQEAKSDSKSDIPASFPASPANPPSPFSPSSPSSQTAQSKLAPPLELYKYNLWQLLMPEQEVTSENKRRSKLKIHQEIPKVLFYKKKHTVPALIILFLLQILALGYGTVHYTQRLSYAQHYQKVLTRAETLDKAVEATQKKLLDLQHKLFDLTAANLFNYQNVFNLLASAKDIKFSIDTIRFQDDSVVITTRSDRALDLLAYLEKSDLFSKVALQDLSYKKSDEQSIVKGYFR